jgi:hypothetical protein
MWELYLIRKPPVPCEKGLRVWGVAHAHFLTLVFVTYSFNVHAAINEGVCYVNH